eukprot:2020949-Lingulodinium_polyedra.AAC.1
MSAFAALRADDVHHPSPWNISQGLSHPLHPSDVASLLVATGGVQSRAQAWVASNNVTVEESRDFPRE